MSASTKCRHGTLIPDNHCWKCYEEYRNSRANEVARSYLTPGTRVGSPTAGVAGDRKKFISTISVETTTDPVLIGGEVVGQGPTSIIIKDQDDERVPAALYERIRVALSDGNQMSEWRDRVQRVLDDWNRDGRYWVDQADQEISERYSDDGSERYPQAVLW